MNGMGRLLAVVASSAAATLFFLLMREVRSLEKLARSRWFRETGNLLQNGSFEDPEHQFVESDNFMMHLDGSPAKAGKIRGWRVVGNPGTQMIAWNHENGTGSIEAQEGHYFIDLTDDGRSAGPYGGVEQTGNLEPGRMYELELYISASGSGRRVDIPEPRSGPEIKVTVDVDRNGAPLISREFTAKRPPKGYRWERCTMLFEAAGVPIGPFIGRFLPVRILIDAPRQDGPKPGVNCRLIAVDNVQLYRVSQVLSH
jgi:hypothetical protein